VPSPVFRTEIADLLLRRLEGQSEAAAVDWAGSGPIRHAVIDDLLPEDLAGRINDAFPKPAGMVLKKSLREHKYIAVQMDRYDPLLEEATYAFQDPRVVSMVHRITGIPDLLPDERLYAGGLSLMGQGQFLHPHVDNSHDKDRNHWRVLNLLYYVSPQWRLADGGNLELWPGGIGQAERQTTVWSRFNRLVLMETHARSWHSVSPITVDRARRCVSNYYFSPQPVHPGDQFHITAFRGRPGDRGRDLLLRADAVLRTGIRKIRARGIHQTRHVYQKPGS
jgi:Rps23 Pro-64 3,4-dihydroxylase Tpa1-like proline 4-hydroxylase